MSGHGEEAGENGAAIIRFDRVCKGYGNCEVLRDFSLDVPAGEFLTVIGSSGGGKTTLLKLINGLLEPESGRVLVEDGDVAAMTEDEKIRLRRRIGYVIQSIGLFPHLSVRANIAYVPRLLGTDRNVINKRLSYLCTVVGLDEAMLNRRPAALSGGQRQRVGIARALAALPRILLMDEPFGAVDAITRSHLQEQIARIHAMLGLTIVFVTHDVDEALKLGTRVLVLDQGGIAQLGTPAELVAAPQSPYVAALVLSRAACPSASPPVSSA